MREPAILSRRAAAVFPLAALAGAAPLAAATARFAASSIPVLAQIELHKVLRVRSNTHPGDDDDPTYHAAVYDEEAAIQALGDMKPTTLFGAAAQLAYMADVEEAFQNNQSPLVRCVRMVAKALAGGLPA